MNLKVAVEVTKSNEEDKGAAQDDVRTALIEELENSVPTIEVENSDGDPIEYNVIFGLSK